MNQCAPHWWVWHGGYHDSWAARENCKTGTEGSRKCGDHIRVRHPVPFHLFLRKSSLISRHHHTCATTCEVLRNLPDTTWPLLPLWHSPLLFASLFLPSRETFPKCDLWSYPCHLPRLPFLSQGTHPCSGARMSVPATWFLSVPWIPHTLCPCFSTWPLASHCLIDVSIQMSCCHLKLNMHEIKPVLPSQFPFFFLPTAPAFSHPSTLKTWVIWPLLPILAFPKASLASFLCDFSYFVLCIVCSSGSQHPCFEYFRASCLALLPAVCSPSSLSYLVWQILQNDYSSAQNP